MTTHIFSRITSDGLLSSGHNSSQELRAVTPTALFSEQNEIPSMSAPQDVGNDKPVSSAASLDKAFALECPRSCLLVDGAAPETGALRSRRRWWVAVSGCAAHPSINYCPFQWGMGRSSNNPLDHDPKGACLAIALAPVRELPVCSSATENVQAASGAVSSSGTRRARLKILLSRFSERSSSFRQ
jgi:hypothetical protein